MKKYVILYVATATLIAAIVLLGNFIKQSVVRVSVARLEPSTAEDTVTCTGRVESYPGNSVYATIPGVVQKIYVQPGDTVSTGQAIMDIMPAASTSSSSSSISYGAAYDAYEAYLRSQSANLSSAPASSSEEESVPDESNTQTYTLVAGNAGTVESLASVSVGSYLDASSPAAVIRNENGMLVRLSVDESRIAEIKEGQKVQISGVGFKNSVYSGVIKSIAEEAKQLVLTTGQETVVEVIASVDKPGSDIKPGYTAQAKITTSQNAKILCVPYGAVRADADGNEFVFCVVNGRAKRTVIVTGKEFDDGFEVKSGLKSGDLVITNPDDVTDGAKVMVVKTAVGKTNG